MYLSTVMAIYKKSIGNIKLSGAQLKVFSLKWGEKKGCPHSLLLDTVLKILGKGIKQEKNKHQNSKGRSKIVSVYRQHNSIFRKSKNATKNC